MVEALLAVVFLVSICTGAMVIRGFTPHAIERRQSTTFRLSAGITLVVLAYVARAFYWGVVPLLFGAFDPGAWDAWFEVSGLTINVFFSLVFLRGLHHLLVLLWLLIPKEDRAEWSIWTAPFYPDYSIFKGLVRFLRFPGSSSKDGG